MFTALTVTLMAGLAAADAGLTRLHGQPDHAFELPKALREVSGLTAFGPTTVLAHDDETARLYEIDVIGGQILRTTDLGRELASGDFEAITHDGRFVYLVTGDGHLFEARLAADSQGARPVNIYDTGLGGICEVEGLAAEAEGVLLLLCKRAERKSQRGRLMVFRWRIAERLTPPEAVIDRPLTQLLPVSGKDADDVLWTGLERDPATGNLYALSSRGHWLVELTPEGRLAGSHRLAASHHPQAEGIALLPGGMVVIADEGGKGRGRLSVYTVDAD